MVSALKVMTGVILVIAGVTIASRPSPDSVSEAVRAGALGVSTFVVFQSAFARSTSLAARALSWTPLRWLGNVSYSYYLVHGLALNAMVVAIARLGLAPGPRPLVVLAGVAPAFAATLGLSLVLFLLVERPFSLEPAAKRTPRRPSYDSIGDPGGMTGSMESRGSGTSR
jgi:peptidoglycan/LPS O-acetylase OafA/YrhL